MANGHSQLFDLCITLDDDPSGAYRARYELQRRQPYPPLPRWTEAGPTLADEVEIVAGGEEALSAAALRAGMLPETSWAGADSGEAGLRAALAAWPIAQVAERMRGVTAALFAGSGRRILQQFLQAVPMPHSPWELPAVVGRITLALNAAPLRRIPWEWMAWEGGELWRRCAILRRSEQQAYAIAPHPPFKLPITVAIGKLAAAAGESASWGDRLFDGFTFHARNLGGITWSETTGRPGEAHIHHLVFSSGEAPRWTPGIRLAMRGGGFREVGGREEPSGWQRLVRAVLVADVVHRGLPAAAPRLLILHDLAATFPAYLTAPLLAAGLAQGADAVLLVSFAQANPAAGDFFPHLYRKLMHNWPLDQAVYAALRLAADQGALPMGWALASRPGGELRLLLTNALVENAVVPAPKAPVRWRKWEGLPQAVARSRQERAQADLEQRLQAATEAQQAELMNRLARATGLRFDSESHDVRRVVEEQDQIAAAAQAAANGQSAASQVNALTAEGVQAATTRLTNLWLEEGPAGGRKVPLKAALVVGQPYTLHVQIAPRVTEALAVGFPEEALERVFQRHDKIRLDVAFFSPKGDFALERSRTTLNLPRVGPSDEAIVRVTPQAAGTRRLRVGIYYRNVLLQSVLLEAAVVEPGATATAGGMVARIVDYIASTDLALLDELPPPTVNIFTNEGSDGSHWIGVFAAEASPLRLHSGQMYTFGSQELATLAASSRELLAEIQGKNVYRLAGPLPLDAEGRLNFPADALKRRMADLVRLAVEGWKLYDALFFSRADAEYDRAEQFDAALNTPGLVSVARCRGESVTVPWAALYRLPLDTGKAGEIAVCPLFQAQLAANRWSADGRQLVAQADLLDDPLACRAQAACPLSDATAGERTVCPFGFWGFLHQVEQPLQQVTPTPIDRVPAEMQEPQFNQTSFLPVGSEPHLALGVYPGFKDANVHRDEIAGLAPGLQVQWQADRDQVLALLRQGGQQFYYFYCHGELQGNEFRLKLGPATQPGYIAAADLHPTRILWRRQAEQPLVILNGCETMALTPELIHGFLGKLRLLGASGVVGTEIKVWTELARPVGVLVLKHLLEGCSLGEAFLRMRHHLLRQYNPLGLAYTYHAPATLHLHPANCAWCRTHPGLRT